MSEASDEALRQMADAVCSFLAELGKAVVSIMKAVAPAIRALAALGMAVLMIEAWTDQGQGEELSPCQLRQVLGDDGGGSSHIRFTGEGGFSLN